MSLSNFDLSQNYYSFNGNNTIPIVFIHGVGLDHQMWDLQIEALKDFSTLTYDLLGHGKTPWTKKNLEIQDFSNQLNQLLDHLKFEKIHLVGFSLGSLIAINYAADNQNKIEKLILIGTTYKRSDQERALVLDRYNQAKLNKPISSMALKRWFSDDYLKNHPKTYDLFMNILQKNPDDHSNFMKAYKLFANYKDDEKLIKKIKTKTLVITGSNDTGSTPLMSRELCKDLNNADFIEIKNGKHLCSIEYSDDVNISIEKFIKN